MQVLSCEICEIFKNTYFDEQLQTALSEASLAKWVGFLRHVCKYNIKIILT